MAADGGDVAARPGVAERRAELGGFLRTRRTQIPRAELGLPATSRRRTSGLRREEVAYLSGVSITWYTWLEQGCDTNPSRQVLDAIARTLRLSSAEHAYLLSLAGHSAPQPTPIPPARPTARSTRPAPARRVDRPSRLRHHPHLGHLRSGWSNHVVEGFTSRERRFRHPIVGDLHRLALSDQPGLHVVIYTPAPDTDTPTRLHQLLTMPPAST